MIYDLLKKYSLLSLFFAGIFLSQSCDKKLAPPDKPANLIQRDTLSSIMLDVYIAESAIYLKSQRGIDLGLYTTVYYNSLFKKHSVTKRQFTESICYYLETDNNASSLFLNVINRLVSMQKPSNDKPTQIEKASD